MKSLFGQVNIIIQDEELVVLREGSVIFKDGKPVKRDITKFMLTCNVQPVDGKDLLLVPEGDRYKENLWVWTNQVQHNLKVNERVVRDCKNYQVQSVEDWGSYTKARITQIDVGPNATT